MTCLDEQDQRWYCYKDDQVYLAKEGIWSESIHVTSPKLTEHQFTQEELLRYHELTDFYRRSHLFSTDESVEVGESSVWYLKGHSRYPHPMWGRLMLTDKRLIFIHQEQKFHGYINIERELDDLEVCIDVPTTSIQGVHLIDQETFYPRIGRVVLAEIRYKNLAITLASQFRTTEEPVFQVEAPERWQTLLAKYS